MTTRGDESLELEAPDWAPTPEIVAASNVGWLMQRTGAASYGELHRWSVRNREEYWKIAIERLGVRFRKPFDRVADLSAGIESPRWLPGAELNIVESCFSASPGETAIIEQTEGGKLSVTTYGELQTLAGCVAANLARLGYRPGDALAILMPMTTEAVAIYLGIVAAGCAVVGIADSFSPPEIAARLRLSGAAALFTQDFLVRGGKTLPLYERIIEAGAPRAIVLTAEGSPTCSLRKGDCRWRDFLQSHAAVEAAPREPGDVLNVLFSSGTSGEPKAIPWTHTTPIKCAADAHFHQNVQPGDVLIWPTNLGWMMGPWLIFASLMNRAAMGLYDGAPTGRDFGQFVQDTNATMLGVVPSLVRTWRAAGCMDGLDWSAIELFSSTGECSSADDMRWLMQLAGGRPVIEYCGGTEIGGAYITATVARPCLAGTFNTPALGLDFAILDEEGRPAKSGELFLVPPSIGLSATLIGQDHHAVYFAGTPCGPHREILRRHGDEMEALPDGHWRAKGRADDTMNLGGIKVGSAEIERVLRTVPEILETAAIAVASDGGPSQLVIYAVCPGSRPADKERLADAMQRAIKRDLNPLFKIHDVVLVETLPRTASNKVVRRELRTRRLSAP